MRTNHNLIHLLNQQARFISKEVNNSLKPFNLYHSQWMILHCLDRFGPMTQTDIWTYLNVEAPTVTRTLARMEKNGWIIRAAGEDKRERIIRLTEEAKAKLPMIAETIQNLEDELLSSLTEEEEARLNKLLSKIGIRADRM